MEKKPLILMIVCTFLIAFAQLFIKRGVTDLSLSILNILQSEMVIFGGILYILAVFFLVSALKYNELSTIYPIISLSFIWVTILSIYILNETLGLSEYIGIILIVGGVSLISYKRENER